MEQQQVSSSSPSPASSPSSAMEQTGTTKTYKRRYYAPRIYNYEKKAEYYKRAKSRLEVKLYEYTDWGTLKNILTLKDKNGDRWFVAAQVYKEICGKRFRQTDTRNSIFQDHLKLFCDIELPPMTETFTITPTGLKRPLIYERNPSVTKKTMFISEISLPTFISTFSPCK